MLTRDYFMLTRWLRPRFGRGWLPIIAVTLLCWVSLAVKNRAEQIDTGWSVATPGVSTITITNGGEHRSKPVQHAAETTNSIVSPSKTSDPQQRLVFLHILEQTQTPLLPARPTPNAATADNASPQSATSVSGAWRIAVRPDGIEGWRSANSVFIPVGDHSATQPREPYGAAAATELSAAHKPGPSLIPGVVEESGTSIEAEQSPVEETPIVEAPVVEEPVEETPVVETPDADEPATVEESDVDEPASPEAEVQEVQQPEDTTANVDRVEQTGPLPEAAPSPASLPPLTKQMMALRQRVRAVLKGYYRKPLNSRDNDPWEVMHGMLQYGVHSRVRQGGPRGGPVTSVGWLCYNKPCKGQTLMYVTPKGELRAKYGVGLQGHLGQLLAMLAQCHVSADYPIRIGKREFTIHDLIEAEKQTCYPKSELTFKLIALQYYLDLNDKWVNDQGVNWDFPRLIREELAQPIRGAACGGTHRLSSLSLTVKTRLRRGEPLDGEYARAAEFVKRNHQHAFKLQNRDGSLSTAWFQGRGDDPDKDRRIKTTGHILEWLCYSLSDEELRQPQTVRAVTYLANLMYSNYDHEWEVGPVCHATHALLLYDERVFQPYDGTDYEAIYKPKTRTAVANRPQPPSDMIRR